MNKPAKVTDLQYLESIAGGSREMMADMISIFKEQVGEFASEMRQLLNSESYHELGLLAHKAKSSVAIMGMDDLAGMLKKFELQAKASESPGDYNEYVREFEDQCHRAIEELDAFLESK